jgi:hypothetical protein
MENGGIFYVRLVHFMTVWYILWPLGIFCGHLVNYLLVFWYFLVILVYFTSFRLSFQEKSGNLRCGLYANPATSDKESKVDFVCLKFSRSSAQNHSHAMSRTMHPPTGLPEFPRSEHTKTGKK